MADLSDVENTLKAILAAAIYPNGTGAPSAILQASTPVPCVIVRGWPIKDQLAQNIGNSVATVSIYAPPGMERNTTRFPRSWTVLSVTEPTITASLSGRTITFGGAVSAPQNIAVKCNGQAFTYAVQSGDSLASIAAALAALINAETPASSAGPVLTLASASDVSVAIGGSGTAIRELRRQERVFQVSIWCSTPQQRDAVTPFVDGVLAGVGLTNGREFINLPDGSEGRILYSRTNEIDKDQLVGAFRRDLIYSVEYGTTEVSQIAQIVTIETTLTPSDGQTDNTPPVITTNI